MARKQDHAAERARKQKIFLAVAGVLFLGLVVIQGPKLLKQVKGSSSTTTAAATTTTSSESSPSTGAPAPTPQATAAPTSSGTAAATTTTTPPVKAPKGATAELAGVVIVNEQPAKAGEGQLDSFTMFEPKDPFVQKVDPNAHPDGSASAAPASTTTSQPQPSTGSGSSTATPTASAAPDSPPSDGSVGPATPAPTKPLAPTAAMLRVNGVLQLVSLKNRFPRGDKAFVLRKLTRKGTAVIAVAGGSFAKGATLSLTLGRSVTLVNTATGARYVVKLVWLGADASQVARFTAKAK